MPDIFDSVSESYRGDIFDQVHAQQGQTPATPAESPQQEMARQLAALHGLDQYAPQLNQAAQIVRQTPNQPIAPIQPPEGALANIAADYAQRMGKPIGRMFGRAAEAIGLATPGVTAELATSPNQYARPTLVGGLLSTTAKAMGGGPLFPLEAGAEGSEGAQEHVEQLQAGGANISPEDHFRYVAEQGVIDAAMAELFNRNVVGTNANPIRAALAPYARPLIASAGARFAVGSLIGLGQSIASNLVTKGTVDPKQPVMEGALESAGTTGLAEAAVGALHPMEPVPIPARTPGRGLVRGQTKELGLSPLGHQQAQELSQQIHDVAPPTSIVSSDMDRAIQTAQAIGPIDAVDPLLRSKDHGPVFTGRLVDAVVSELDRLVKQAPDEIPPGGGESETLFKLRMEQLAQKHVAQQEQDPAQRPLYVTHNGVINIMKAAVDQGKYPNISEVDTAAIPREGEGVAEASVHAVHKDAAGKYTWLDKDSGGPDILYARHGDTPWNPGPNYPAGAAPAEPTPAAPPTEIQPAVGATQAETSAQRPPTAPAPSEFTSAKDLGQWYGKTFGDEADAPLIETLAEHAAKGKGYKLAEVPIEKAFADEAESPERVAKYAAMPKETQPPIIMDSEGNVFDGVTRLNAAKARGDTTVQAYVPEDSELAKPTTANLLTRLKAEVARTGQLASRGKQLEELYAPRPTQEPAAETLPQKLRRLATSESGTDSGTREFVQQDIEPKLEAGVSYIKSLWKGMNVRLGTGKGLSPAEHATQLDISQHLGEHERNIAQIERAVAPAREALSGPVWSTSSPKGAGWIDEAEATGHSAHPDPATQAALDFNNALNVENEAAGKKVGIRTDKWNPDWIGRLFTKDPEAKPSTPGGGKTSLQGEGGFLYSRDYDTYSDALAAAKEAGMRPLYDNPMDMMVAKQAEARRWIGTKQLIHNQEDAGALTWVKDGERPPDGSQKLQDRSAVQERDVIAPKWQAGRLAKMNTYEGDKYIAEQRDRGNMQVLRPGKEVPEGFVKIGRTERGAYYGTPTTAQLFDSQISNMPQDSPLRMVSNVAHKISAVQYAINTAHAGLTLASNVGLMTGKAIENLAHGEGRLALQNIFRALDPTAQFGRELREQIVNPEANPQLEDIAKRMTAANPSLQGPSVLRAQHSWSNVVDTWNSGNPLGALLRATGFIAGQVHNGMSEFVKNAKAQYEGAAAETSIQRGESLKASRGGQAQARSTADSMFGFADSKARFQNEVYKAARDLIFSAGQYTEGPIRLAAGTAEGTVRALGAALRGDKANIKITPAMQAVLGSLVTHAATNAALQIGITWINTGKPIMPTGLDYLRFRTGKKDDAGRDERVSLPGLTTAMETLFTKPDQYFYNRLTPLIRGPSEAIRNRDFRGQQLYGSDEPTTTKIAKGAEHVAGEIAPRAIGGSAGGSSVARDIGARLTGMRFAHEGSAAVNRAHEFMGRQAPDMTTEQMQAQATTRDLTAKMRKSPAEAGAQIRAGLRTGAVTPQEARQAQEKAQRPQNILGTLQGSGLGPREIMEVWNEMTPEEKKDSRWFVQRRIAGSEAEGITPAEKKTFIERVRNESR